MVYLDTIILPSYAREVRYLTPDYSSMDPKPGYIEICNPRTGEVVFEKINFDVNRTCINSHYPFEVLSLKGLEQVTFSDITLLSGGNGSGKTTLLNIIAQKLGLRRETPYNRSAFYDDYLLLCQEYMADLSLEADFDVKRDGKIITSDDVFDYNLRVREKSNSMDLRRGRLFDKRSSLQLPRSIDTTNSESVARYQEILRIKRESSSSTAK